MKRFEVLKAAVILQAVCMIALSAVVIMKVWPDDKPSPGSNDADAAVKPSVETARDKTVASVGGADITAGELADKLQEQYGESMLQTMMLHKAIDLEAKESGITVSALEKQRELEERMEGYESEDQYFRFMNTQLGMSKAQVMEEIHYKLLLEKLAIRSIVISDDEIESYLEANAEQYAPHLQFHLRWIVTESRQLAEEVLGLLQGGEPFGSMASAYSVDEYTANSGGDLGMIEEDDPFYEAELLETARRLQVGEMAGPIPIEGGYAVIQLMERQQSTALTGRRLRDEVRKQLSLERAKPLKELEEELLAKYRASRK